MILRIAASLLVVVILILAALTVSDFLPALVRTILFYPFIADWKQYDILSVRERRQAILSNMLCYIAVIYGVALCGFCVGINLRMSDRFKFAAPAGVLIVIGGALSGPVWKVINKK